ncbi:OmpA family protein [Thalassomonas viridans]|uniref:OmpA family protein n=2 Tax=Thalassomonas viridans TaxID=137584 RepID=A0AAE9Z848_9GAMM|nr:OmpA family protein [Thalassomonas viridans]
MHRQACLFILTLVLLTACSSSPPIGRGGFAEHHLESGYPVEADQPLTPAHGLRFDFSLLSQQLDILIQEGAELCFPATVVQAKTRLKRIAREIAGGLIYDAANDIIIQRRLISRLERQLDYVNEHEICSLPRSLPLAHPGKLGEKLDHLLNHDNQFATGSFALNPKYMAQLAEAAVLLKQSPEYHLLITGHADDRGNQDYNLKLSDNRAKQVARYLHIFGISRKRIHLSAVGEDNPLFTGNEAQVRLVNRRVSIELIENPERQKSRGEQDAL